VAIQVYVKVVNVETGLEFEWEKGKFLDRLYLMKEMYQRFESGEEWDVGLEKDPFYEDPWSDRLIGSAQVFLQPMAYLVEIKEQPDLIDYSRNEVGIVSVEIVPCNAAGHEYSEHDDIFVDSPSELLGRDMHFVMKIHGCRGLPARFTVRDLLISFAHSVVAAGVFLCLGAVYLFRGKADFTLSVSFPTPTYLLYASGCLL
jgi:hypothetical protein